jgi:acid phosphatase
MRIDTRPLIDNSQFFLYTAGVKKTKFFLCYFSIAGFFILFSANCNLSKSEPPPSECRPEFTVPLREPGEHYLDFMAVGDAGTGTDGQKWVAGFMEAYAGKNPVEFVLYLGDNFYPHGVNAIDDPRFQSQFEEIYDKRVLNIPFYVVAGNHDYEGDVSAQVAYTGKSSRWRFPGLYYTFTITRNGHDLVQFFAIDTTPIVKWYDINEQIDRLIDELSRSIATWKILFGHHPIFSNGKHGDYYRMKVLILHILEAFDVDIYISGHDHDLQILKPSRKNGVYCIVSGTGASYRDTWCRENSIYAASRLGFVAFRVSESEIAIFVVLNEGNIDYCYVISK